MAYRLGLLGYPVGHSVSPQLHTFFLQQLGLTGDYEAFTVSSNALPDFWATTLPALSGLNVTIPHKQAAFDWLQAHGTLSDVALRVGAVNTLVKTDTGWHGENTDVSGFLTSLPADWLQHYPAKQPVLILGMGGAARAIVEALLSQRPDLTVLFQTRSEQTAPARLASLQQLAAAHGAQPGQLQWQPALTQPILAETDWVINTTPVGMSQKEATSTTSPLSSDQLTALPAQARVDDLIYNPLDTPLLAQAQARGLTAQNGLSMLVHQGANAFALWTGQSVSTELRLAAMAHLTGILR